MKPKTKKTLIITAVVIAVVLIVWLLFFRKKGWEKIIDNLDISKSEKQTLKNRVKAIVSDSAFDKSYYENLAAQSKITYDEYLVIEAAFQLGWPAGITDGGIFVRPTK